MWKTTLFVIAIYFYAATGQWIDPHSMDSSAKKNLPSHNEKAPDLNTAYCSKVVTCNSDLHLRRLVRLILRNSYLDKVEDEHFAGHLHIKLSAREYEFLANFSQNDDSQEEIFSEVSSVFEGALEKPSFDEYKEMILSFQEELYFLIFNRTSGALVGTCVVLYITYKLLRANFTWRLILKYFCFLLYISDFLITYLHILQKDEIENMVTIKKLGTTPPECDPNKMSWWTYTKTHFETVFFENPCQAYYHATNPNLVYLVTPTRVLTTQFRTIIVEPIGDIGEAFGKFGRGMFTNLPWGLNIILFPIMIIAAISIIFLIFLFITKPNFKLSLFHLFTIELGQQVTEVRIEDRRRNNQNALRDGGRIVRPLRAGNDGIREVEYSENSHRNLIEDLSHNNDSSHDSEHNGIGEIVGANEDEDGQLKDDNIATSNTESLTT